MNVVNGRNPIRSISPKEYEQMVKEKRDHVLVDVRELWEYQLARINNAELMPLPMIDTWSLVLPRNKVYVLMCHHGIRSVHACRVMAGIGFSEVYNLSGGIDAWSRDVDSGVPKY